ncbi:MAG TPA: glycoside hydrolase [Kouleothrix sp.]|nr:glycoside hydrolase [Kouleothrix sp.]
MQQIVLDQGWEFRSNDTANWQPIPVPGCWEQLGIPLEYAGPCWYRTTIHIPADWVGRRTWLCFGGVSYHCAVSVNGQPVGEHTGLWDAFELEITAAVTPETSSELLLHIEKPASLTAGPDSLATPGRFRLRETLAGFLPYVWGHMFGGIWQPVALRATGTVVFEDVLVRGAADGTVELNTTTSAPAILQLTLYDPDGREILTTELHTSARGSHSVAASITHQLHITTPRPWSPASPVLYTARLVLNDGDERTIRFGLRSLHADGSRLLLNDAPLSVRMALSWGWYPETLHSNPGPARARADFARLKALGYNGVKLCLWFPPQYYFDLADELGMLLWVELPMWIPQPSAFFRAQVPAEYDRLMRQARQHPSVILYTLGCELSHVVDAQMLAPLFALVKRHAGDALVRDNSGSGEAYGGLLNEFAEFYDYHFYSELHHFRPLLDYFAPRGRPPQPWLFGEFCDYDTFRDPLPLGQAAQSWWASNNPSINPQGARWQYDLPYQAARLHATGLSARVAELERISFAQGLWHRKYTIEQTRLFHEIAGYVVTGEADTPISTAGMWDARDQLKFEPAAFRAFNADTVLLVGWDRRRDWVAGGDRAAPWDIWNYPMGTIVRAHFILSHYGAERGPLVLRWQAALATQAPLAQGTHESAFALTPGDLRELAVAEFAAPYVSQPQKVLLTAEADLGGTVIYNTWQLWFFPRDGWRTASGIALHDPAGRLHDLPRIAPGISVNRNTPHTLPATSVVLISTVWNNDIGTWIERGGRAIILLANAEAPGPVPVRAMPFWREAIRLAEPHAAWGDFPLDDALATQMFGCAADCALDLVGYTGQWQPLLRRLDARTMFVHEYAAELQVGNGRAILSTLRVEGGQGAQPLGIARNTAAAYLLWCWARYLAAQ